MRRKPWGPMQQTCLCWPSSDTPCSSSQCRRNSPCRPSSGDSALPAYSPRWRGLSQSFVQPVGPRGAPLGRGRLSWWGKTQGMRGGLPLRAVGPHGVPLLSTGAPHPSPFPTVKLQWGGTVRELPSSPLPPNHH